MTLERIQQLAFRTDLADRHSLPRQPACRNRCRACPSGAPRAGDRFPWLRLKLLRERARRGPVQRRSTTRDFTPDRDRAACARERGMPAWATCCAPTCVTTIPPTMRELARAQIPRPSFYLLRPDGHVGLGGTRLEPAAVARYVGERVKLGSAARQ